MARSPSQPLTVALAAVAVSVLAVVGVLLSPSEPVAEPRQPGALARDDPLEVLHQWDERRAAAWAAGDVAALAALYTPTSSAGRRDVRMLRAYLRRGFRVEGMARQVQSVRVADRTDGRLAVVVVDRLASATAVGDGVRRPLPGGSTATHALVFHRVDGRWVMARARAVGDDGPGAFSPGPQWRLRPAPRR